MANPAKLEINSWIETVKKQIDRAAESDRANNRGKRGRGPATPEPDEAQAALIALEDLHKLLAARSEELDLHELEFLERSQRLESAATQLEEQVRQVSLSKQVASNPSDNATPSCWNEGKESASFPAADPVTTSSPALPVEIVDSLAERLAERLSGLLDAKLQQLTFHAARAETSEAAEEELAAETRLSEMQLELDIASTTLRDYERLVQTTHDESQARIAELRDELTAVYETNAALQAELLTAKENLWSLDEHPVVANADTDSAMIADLQAEIESLQVTLAAVRSSQWETSPCTKDAATGDSSAELHRMKAELADLREQNADLATQLARIQMAGIHNAPHLNLGKLSQESMTWEQRKRLILQQLENETAAANPEEYQNHRNEVEEILRSTQAEIERRDAEIAELQSIVQQQSNTREGVAIGAAAIAQMLDSDELVKLEREKLATIQQQWEAKLREAEIELSLERAKLSRERAELEERLRNPADAIKPVSTEPTTTPDGKPVRRWLEHLGLRDK